jgi:hypothetical protein
MRKKFGVLALLMMAPLAAGAAPEGIKVAPTSAQGEHVSFPRLVQFPDAGRTGARQCHPGKKTG